MDWGIVGADFKQAINDPITRLPNYVIHRSTSRSAVAAPAKSFSVSPLSLWVEYASVTRLWLIKMSG